MNPVYYNYAICGFGLFFLLRNFSLLKNDDKLKTFLESNRKARFWINKFGIERTIGFSKRYFLPLGILVSMSFVILGVWGIYSGRILIQ